MDTYHHRRDASVRELLAAMPALHHSVFDLIKLGYDLGFAAARPVPVTREARQTKPQRKPPPRRSKAQA